MTCVVLNFAIGEVDIVENIETLWDPLTDIGEWLSNTLNYNLDNIQYMVVDDSQKINYLTAKRL